MLGSCLGWPKGGRSYREQPEKGEQDRDNGGGHEAEYLPLALGKFVDPDPEQRYDGAATD